MGAVNIFSIRPVLFTCGILLGSACSADIDAESIEVFDHASRNILKATVSQSERIEYCNNLKNSNSVPKFDLKNLASLNATRDDVITAVAFLKFNNDFLCQRQTRLELAFHLGTMAALKRELKTDPSSIDELQSMISYPSSRELEFEVNYLKLSQPQRNYFESIVGERPFDLLEAFEANNLSRE